MSIYTIMISRYPKFIMIRDIEIIGYKQWKKNLVFYETTCCWGMLLNDYVSTEEKSLDKLSSLSS